MAGQHRPPPYLPDRRLVIGCVLGAVLLIALGGFAAAHKTADQKDTAINVANAAAEKASTIIDPVLAMCAGHDELAEALHTARTSDGKPFCAGAAEVKASPVISNPVMAAGLPSTVTVTAPPAPPTTITQTATEPAGLPATVTQTAPPGAPATVTATAPPGPPATITATAPPATVTQTASPETVTQTATQPPETVTQTENPPPTQTETTTETAPPETVTQTPDPPADTTGGGDGSGGGITPLPTMTDPPAAPDPPAGELTVPNLLPGLLGGSDPAAGRSGGGGPRNHRGR